jgi:DNA-binding beta-propeller fold protein YncE
MKNNSILVLIAGLLLLGSTMLQAAQAKFSIIPTAGSVTSFLLPNNFTETVSYQVTNQTNITRTLTIVPMPGVSQLIGSDTCQNPFTLSPQQTCTLTLTINASQIPSSGINGGPVVCKTKSANDASPDLFLCSQPDPTNTLAVSVTNTAGQHIYVANQFANSVSYCQVNIATGLLTQCAVTATGLDGLEGTGFNPAGTFFYSANALSNSISVCQVNAATGALSGCTDSGGTGFNLPNAISFSPDGSVLYTSNLGGTQNVSACLVNATTGLLSSCVNNLSPTFGAPAGMAVNSAGTFAYVANRSTSTISVCNVSGQTVTSCNDLSGNFIDEPEGVTLDAANLHAYITNAGSKQVVVCDILQNGTGLLANCSVTNGDFEGTGSIGFNNLGTVAYVPNQLLNAVFECNVTLGSGQLSGCIPAGGTGFVGPAGVVLH